MASPAKAVLESLWSVAARVARYLGPLLKEALTYLWRLTLDAAGGLRLLFLYWRARRSPAQAPEYAARRQQLREDRAARWNRWRELTVSRRVEIRAAAALLLWIAFAVLPDSQRRVSVAFAPSPETDEPRSLAGHASTEAAADAVDAGRAAARFATDRQRLGRGEWVVLRDVPVITRGSLGAWDDYALAFPVVLKEDGRGKPYRMWFRGCHMALREFSCGVGHAQSFDGVAWKKSPEPVFMPDDPSLRKSLDAIDVVKAGGRYYLWYSVMADYFDGRRRAALYLATSADGLAWKDDGRVLEAASENPPMVAHSVLHDGQRFHLWYVTSVPGAGQTPTRVLQHLSSPDGKVWTDLGSTPLQEAFGASSMPEILRVTVSAAKGGGYRGYTYERGFNAVTSQDGTQWTKADLKVGPLGVWRKEGVDVHAISALHDEEGLWFWMDISSPPQDLRVGVAFRKDDEP